MRVVFGRVAAISRFLLWLLVDLIAFQHQQGGSLKIASAECLGTAVKRCSDYLDTTCSAPLGSSSVCFRTKDTLCSAGGCDDAGCSCNIRTAECFNTYCDYDLTCTGVAQSCGAYTSEFSCEDIDGCFWQQANPPPSPPPTPTPVFLPVPTPTPPPTPSPVFPVFPPTSPPTPQPTRLPTPAPTPWPTPMPTTAQPVAPTPQPTHRPLDSYDPVQQVFLLDPGNRGELEFDQLTTLQTDDLTACGWELMIDVGNRLVCNFENGGETIKLVCPPEDTHFSFRSQCWCRSSMCGGCRVCSQTGLLVRDDCGSNNNFGDCQCGQPEFGPYQMCETVPPQPTPAPTPLPPLDSYEPVDITFTLDPANTGGESEYGSLTQIRADDLSICGWEVMMDVGNRLVCNFANVDYDETIQVVCPPEVADISFPTYRYLEDCWCQSSVCGGCQICPESGLILRDDCSNNNYVNCKCRLPEFGIYQTCETAPSAQPTSSPPSAPMNVDGGTSSADFSPFSVVPAFCVSAAVVNLMA